MRISKTVDIRVNKTLERKWLKILDLLSELWNMCIDDQKERYDQTGTTIPFYEYDKFYYPEILASNEKYSEVPSKARQNMYRRCCDVAWRHMIPKSGDKIMPYKNSNINSFFFCRYGIRFKDDTCKHIWISNFHFIRLKEIGYITPDDIKYITSGSVVYRRTIKKWSIRFILDVPDDYFINKKKEKIQKQSGGIGIDLGIHRYATIASEDSSYEIPESISKLRNPVLDDKHWAMFKRTQQIDGIINRIVDHNMEHYGYDPKSLSSRWSIPSGLNKYIYHSRKLDALYYRRAKIIAAYTRYRSDFIKKLVSELIYQNHRFICIESMDLQSMLTRRHSRGHMIRRKLGLCSFGYFILHLKQKCSQFGIPIIEADMTFPSTQICSICGTRKHKSLTLDDRDFICDNSSCIGSIVSMDRDMNAAINLLKYGQDMLN